MDQPRIVCEKDFTDVATGWTAEATAQPKSVKILPELEAFEIPPDVKVEISEFYVRASGQKTHRKAPRRAIIYCCAIKIFKKYNIVFDDRSLMNTLDIKISDVNKANKTVYANVSNEMESVSIKDLFKSRVKSLDITESVIDIAMDIYNKCRRIIPEFNSSKQETLCEAVIFSIMKKNVDGFNEDSFFASSSVGRETVMKIVRLIDSVSE